jgi:hypothetical protein
MIRILWMFNFKSRWAAVLWVAVILFLYGCAAATAQPTLVPTISMSTPTAAVKPTRLPETPAAGLDAATAYPPALLPTGYPAPGDSSQGLAYPGPEGVPARPNATNITARLIEMAPVDTNPGTTRLTSELLSTQPAGSEGDFASARIGQQVDLFAQGIVIPELTTGDTFNAEVTYMGDESGGQFIITQFLP